MRNVHLRQRVNQIYLQLKDSGIIIKNVIIRLDISFHGQLKNALTCLVCGKESITFEPFFTLPLSIPTMKRVELIIVPSINIKNTVRLTIYVSESALFLDIGIYLKKYFFFNLSDKDEIKERIDKYRCLLVNAQSQTARFVKNTDNIYNISKKGFIFCYEVDGRVEGDDYYPFITLIKSDNKANEFLSYPRLFAVNSNSNVKDLRKIIYAFMLIYYTADIDEKYKELILKYSNDQYIDVLDYNDMITKLYNSVSNNNVLNISYKVNLISPKDETKTIPLFVIIKKNMKNPSHITLRYKN